MSDVKNHLQREKFKRYANLSSKDSEKGIIKFVSEKTVDNVMSVG